MTSPSHPLPELAHSLRSGCSIVVEYDPFSAQARAIIADQQAFAKVILQISRIGSKICITLHVRRVVQKGQTGLNEGLHVRVVVVLVHAELGDPERSPSADAVRLRDILLEVDFVVRTRVPVDRHKVDCAARTIPQEVCQVGQRVRRPPIRDSGRAEQEPAGERLDVGAVRGDGFVDAHAGRAAKAAVGLVEGEDGVGAVLRNRGVDVGGEDSGQGWCVVEEHWDECQGRVEAAVVGVGKREVVVGPGNTRVLARKCEVVRVGIVAIH